MRKPTIVCLGIAALLTTSCGTAQESADLPEVTMSGEREQILKSHNGRYSKHGWNHYGPGYFDLDPETGVLTSHGGMGLFWYSVKEYGNFVLDLLVKLRASRLLPVRQPTRARLIAPQM